MIEMHLPDKKWWTSWHTHSTLLTRAIPLPQSLVLIHNELDTLRNYLGFELPGKCDIALDLILHGDRQRCDSNAIG